MDENDDARQALAIAESASRTLSVSRITTTRADGRCGLFRFELNAYRSLGANGFWAVMALVVAVNVVVGVVFMIVGAWPVLGFCGLDVALVFFAFKLNYRSGRTSETIDVSPQALTLTRTHPSGDEERHVFNPSWVRVRLMQRRDGRNELRLASHGEELHFGAFLSDSERRQFARSLTGALLAARSASWG